MARSDKLPKFLSGEEVARLLGQPNERYYSPCRDKLMMRVQLSAGLRPGEVVALKPENIDFNSGRIDISEGKSAKDCVVLVGNRLIEDLQAWMERRPGSEWLFPTSKGRKVDTSYLRRSVKRYAEEAGLGELNRISPHTLRHTFATKLYRSAGSIRRVQKALGHSDLSATMIYTHVAQEELETDMKGLWE
jgi:site-specific recombinase XerD